MSDRPGMGTVGPVLFPGAASRPDLAIFVATSGHSGVDTIVRNLLPEFGAFGWRTEVLRIAGHGPHVTAPSGTRVVDLKAGHVETALPALVRYLRRQRPRVLLTDKDSVNRVAIVARALARVDTRLVIRLGTTVSVNLLGKRRWQAMLQRVSIQRLYRRADAIVVPSRGAATDLAGLMSVPTERIDVLPNPIVREALFRAADEEVGEPWLSADRDRPVIVAAGSLTERKDYAMLVRAFAALRQRRACRLILIGRGRCRDALERQCHALGIAEDVRFTGFLDNPYPYLRRADIFAHSARWEGLGIVLVEALALGTPVVATDCPSGPAEILDHGRFGTLVPVGDDARLADALLAELEHPRGHEILQTAVTRYGCRESAAAYARVLGLAPGRS